MATRLLIIISFCLAASTASAQALSGKVVSIADGDTLTVLVDRKQVKVRLVEIDAPESKQPYGQKSKQSLSEVCAGKQAQIADKGKDRYGRTLGRVTCGGIDANAEQVKRGMAWVFDRYATDRAVYALQDDAKAAKRGLVGTFHHVGEQHLQRYVNEFDFRYNHRTKLGYTDTQRTTAALKGISGKRLTYRRTDAPA